MFRIIITIIFATILTGSCKKFIEVGPSRTDLFKETVFEDDGTTQAAVKSIYEKMIRAGSAADGGIRSVSFLAALSADESINYNPFPEELAQFNENDLISDNSVISGLWTQFYDYIYSANVIIEGVTDAQKLTPSIKEQSEGEARFLRAFSYFYLTNLFGDVPLALTSDYTINSSLPKSSQSAVYDQIVEDLVKAQNLLADGYAAYNEQRVRASKGAVTALLARVYLYRGEWANAETQASLVIDNSALYGLIDLNQIFLTNSLEAILQLGKTTDLATDVVSFNYSLFASSSLRQEVFDRFDDLDARKSTWINSVDIDGTIYHDVMKYVGLEVPPLEHTTVLRLAEQYLIRAEARAQQENISGAQEDINMIRSRAGLGDTPANDKASLLAAIEDERLFELFTEWGHRWLDLKRTGRLQDVIGTLKPGYDSHDALYPIPRTQILNDPAMRNAQNPGYN